uniref:ATP synthase complex subunit 8 n=1 Tax=Scirtes orbicularis TaxID=1588440 RepID=A0A343C3R0_9COLE|nr:ATP synthase F0 subunit 8 [Scirtes orbicularis]
MPQMAPMMWLLLFIIFLLTFIFFNLLNFFSSMKFNNMKLKFEKKNNFLSWKW